MDKNYNVVLTVEVVNQIREKKKHINLSGLIRDLLKEYLMEIEK